MKEEQGEVISKSVRNDFLQRAETGSASVVMEKLLRRCHEQTVGNPEPGAT